MTMQELIQAFPSNIEEALEIAGKSTLTNNYSTIDNIVICGMGGSGIGGTLVKGWLFDELKVPVVVVKDYNIPAFVSDRTLVIGSSYSGNTEETLTAIKESIRKGAKIIGICSGGQLQQICEENGYDHIIVPGGNPPRTALAYSLVQLLYIFHKIGLVENHLPEIAASYSLLIDAEAEIKNKAQDLARHLHGKVGVLYATTLYEGAVIRARQQFNENSKSLCWHHVLPEMNHNELVGWGGGDDRFAVVYFENEGINERNKVRADLTLEKISEKAGVMRIVSKGRTIIERSMYMINVVDWASLYLSEMNKVDPIDIAVIDYLKGSLAKI